LGGRRSLTRAYKPVNISIDTNSIFKCHHISKRSCNCNGKLTPTPISLDALIDISVSRQGFHSQPAHPKLPPPPILPSSFLKTIPLTTSHTSQITTQESPNGNHSQDSGKPPPLPSPLLRRSSRNRALSGTTSSFPYETHIIITKNDQSFINTKICYQALPMKEFITLQKRLFPIYFGTQVGLTALTAATHPPYSIISLVQDPWSLAPLAVVAVTGCLNWFIYGPRTTTASLVRRALQGGFVLDISCSIG
jgi:hypothetical protein